MNDNNISTTWFIHKCRKREQKALYHLFVKKKGITVEALKDLLLRFREEILLPRCTSNNQRKYISSHSVLVGEISSLYFSEFISFVTDKTGIKFKYNKHKKKQQDQEDASFAEAQLDYMMHGGHIDDF